MDRYYAKFLGTWKVFDKETKDGTKDTCIADCGKAFWEARQIVEEMNQGKPLRLNIPFSECYGGFEHEPY